MTQRRRLLFVLGSLLLAIAGCQLVAGIQSRTADPLNPGCVLPNAAGFPLVRVANLAPTSDQVDVCMRIAGTSSWGLPIVINGGINGPAAGDGGVTDPSCTTILGASGFTYGTVSLLFSAPGQNIDVKMIPGGSACSATSIAETDGITLPTNANTTLALMGGNNVAETVVPLPEADSANEAAQRYRVVHAAPGTGPLDFGTTAGASLPTTVTADLLSGPVPYGGSVPSGVTATTATITLEDNGYLSLPTGSEYIGANVDGGPPNAVFVWTAASGAATFSLYVIGIPGDNTYPLRALVCSEQAPAASAGQLLSACNLSTLSNLSVDVFNTALYGEDAPNFKPREDLIPNAIAQRTSDLMCVVEVDLNGTNCAQCQNDQQDIISAAAANYPYSFTVSTGLSTPFTNPANQQGVTPPAPTQPPCAGVDPSLIAAPIQCLEQNCSSGAPDAGTGFLDQSTTCITENCASQALQLEAANTACFDCLIVNVASAQSYGDSVTSCTTDSRPPLGFQGAENSIILSRYPLANTDALILPSTDYRRSILYAQVQLEQGQSVDFYCGFLMTTENAGVVPYVGSYGNGPVTDAGASTDGWDNEQLWEATQMVNWINSKSGTGVDGGTADGGAPSPAIVVGDWHSSLAAPGPAPQGINLPNALNPGTMELLTGQSNWFAATPGPNSGSKWTPQCNVCPPPENPYNGPTDQYFFSQPFLVNWPSDQVQAATIDESLILNQNVIPLGLDAGSGPLSPYYGVNITVIRPH